MPCAVCELVGSEGAEGKVRSMEVFSSAPVREYFSMEETTVGARRADGGRVW